MGSKILTYDASTWNFAAGTGDRPRNQVHMQMFTSRRPRSWPFAVQTRRLAQQPGPPSYPGCEAIATPTGTVAAALAQPGSQPPPHPPPHPQPQFQPPPQPARRQPQPPPLQPPPCQPPPQP